MLTDDTLIRLTGQAKHSYLITPITDLIASARGGRGKYAILANLDVSYLAFHLMTYIIRNMANHISGVEEAAAQDNLTKMISVMAPEMLDKECVKACHLIIETIMNSKDSYYPYSYRYYDGLDNEFKVVEVKLLELRLDEGKHYYRMAEQGFLVFRSMLVKSVDIQQEMNAFIIQIYMEQKDYQKASELISEGKETIIETQHKLLEMRRKIDHMVEINYKDIEDECNNIRARIDKAYEKNMMTYSQIPALSNDGSKSDSQLKILDDNFLDFIEMFAKTVNMIEGTLSHLESRLISRISQRSGNRMVDFSIYNHVLMPLLLKSEKEIEPLLGSLMCALFPARLRKLDSPYQLVKNNLGRLTEVVEVEDSWQEDKKEGVLISESKEDVHFTDLKHNTEFRNMVLSEIESGPVSMSFLLDKYYDEYSYYKLKSFYLYLLFENIGIEKDKDKDIDVSKIDEIVKVRGIYEGNDLLIQKKTKKEM